MSTFVKYVVEILLSYLKRWLNSYIIKEKKNELKELKQESENEVSEASSAVDDFRKSYELFKNKDRSRGGENSSDK
jgi:hypothetical protein